MAQTQFSKGIKRLRSDNGKEDFNHCLSRFHSKQGTIHEFTCIDTSQQNGIVEGKIITYLKLLIPSSSKLYDLTFSFYSYHAKSLHLEYLGGLLLSMFINNIELNWILKQSSYSPNKKGYKCYHPSSHKYFFSIMSTSMNLCPSSLALNFRERIFLFLGPFILKSPIFVLVPPFPIVLQESTPLTLVPKATNMDKPTSMHQRKDKLDLVSIKNNIYTFDENYYSCNHNLDDLLVSLRKEKRSFSKYLISQFVSSKHALKDEKWVKAMDKEMKALERNGT
ncbi:hypothetical protein CR513_08398, partial [Mucuna pruriens]